MLLLFAGMQRTRASGPVPIAFVQARLPGGVGRIQCVRGNRWEALHPALLSPAITSSPQWQGRY
jgi:hypothetical protein